MGWRLCEAAGVSSSKSCCNSLGPLPPGVCVQGLTAVGKLHHIRLTGYALL